ncbi:conserved hypothetical protein [delta proteobacterium NaphS2]|nr:conserved hypothetical protein [delta proteobacterium NaphS2]
MTKSLKTRFILILTVILTVFLLQAPRVSVAGVVEKFEPVWEQKPSEPEPARLFVVTTPGDARVRILNIRPPFSQGMALAPGRYHVEVSAQGFKTETRWVTLSAGEEGKMTFHLTAVPIVVPERPKPEPAVRGAFTNNLGMKFVYIKPGSFMMGSPSSEAGRDKDERQHRVTLTNGYYLQTTEVTQGQWERVMGSNPSHFENCGSGCPVESVSWEDCQKFIQKLNGMEGTGKYRLPTEAEWEYAAKAGTKTPFYTGDCLSTGQANYDGNHPGNACSKGEYRKKPVVVGSFAPNGWGLYDMHGNVWEWCQDWYGDYPSGSVTDPKGPSGGSIRVFRGGGWRLIAGSCRSANRNWNSPGIRFNNVGFRLAFSADR